jgi:hypothetical protein
LYGMVLTPNDDMVSKSCQIISEPLTVYTGTLDNTDICIVKSQNWAGIVIETTEDIGNHLQGDLAVTITAISRANQKSNAPE